MHFPKSTNPFLHDQLSFLPVQPNRNGPADSEKIFMGGSKPAFVIRDFVGKTKRNRTQRNQIGNTQGYG